MPQLDALRAFAIFSVMLVHWLPENHPIQFTFVGNMGLKMFFVLSGFLITTILVKNKAKISQGVSSKTRYFKQFYIRRTLRIFPVYYVTLALIYWLDVFPVRESWEWHATYMSNWFLLYKGGWYGWTSHFWTLSVEEQFYLIWPVVILLIPQKHFLKMIWLFIVGSILFKIACYLNNVPLIEVLTPSCFDAFAMGGLLAYQKLNWKEDKFARQYNLRHPVFIGGLLAYGLLLLINYRSNEGWLGSGNVFWESFHSIVGSTIFIFIIAKAAKGFSGIGKKILENKALIYLGKISYASYIFHEFMPQLLQWVEVKIGFPSFVNVYARFAELFILTILLASLSWFVVEKPFLSLKRKFKY